MSCYIQTLETDGTPRTTFDEAGGYELMQPLGRPRSAFRRSVASSPFVDGEFETHSSIGRQTLTMTIGVRGTSWAEVEARIQALEDDVTSTHALAVRTVVEGVTTTWQAYRPDLDAPIAQENVVGLFCDVTLTWPVLPHPTIT